MKVKVFSISTGFLALLALGCDSPPPPSKGEVQYAPISVSDAKIEAAKFVKELESTPPDKRGKYVYMHLQEAHTLQVAGDKDLQDHFKILMGSDNQ